MRVLHVVPYFAPSWSYGGVPRAVYELAQEQQKMGYQVSVLTTDAGEKTTRLAETFSIQNGIPVYRCRNLFPWLIWKLHFCTPWRLPQAINLNDFDVIHLHEVRTLLNWLVLKQTTTQRILLSPWGTLPYNQRLSFFKKFLDFWLYPFFRSRKIVAAGQTRHEVQVISDAKIAHEVNLVPLGVEKSQIDSRPALRSAFRKKHSLDDSTFVFLYLGRFSKVKGLALTIRAFQQVWQDFSKQGSGEKKLALICVGRDDGFLSELEQIQSSLEGLPIKILPPMYGPDRWSAYVGADCLVHTPLVFEETATTCLEALQSGTPVITTIQSAIPQVPPNIGIFQVIANQNLIANVMKHIIFDRSLHSNSSREQRRQLSLKIFSWEKVAKQFNRLYCHET